MILKTKENVLDKDFKNYLILGVSFGNDDEIQARIFVNDDQSPIVLGLKSFEIINNKIPDGWVLRGNPVEGMVLAPEEFTSEFWDQYFNAHRVEATLDVETTFKQVLNKIRRFHGWPVPPEPGDDIVEMILDKHDELREVYQKSLENLIHIETETPSLETKLTCLGNSYLARFQDGSTDGDWIINILEELEEFFISESDLSCHQGLQKYVLKPVVSWLSGLSTNHVCYQKRRILMTYAGPMTQAYILELEPKANTWVLD